MRGRSLLMFVALVGVATACEDDDDVRARYTASLNGANERPTAVTTAGTGQFEATLDENNILTYTITFSGLGSNTTLGHIHGPATTAQFAGILIDFNAPSLGRIITIGATSGTATGTVDLNLVTANAAVSGDSLLTLLNNGNAYVNIHTATNGAGEIRGQIIRQ